MLRILALALLACALPAAAFDLQGHRGARGHAPENTLAGFRKALEIGVTTLETDVGITRDGVAVIYHDRRLNAATTRGANGLWLDGPGPLIRDVTAADLAAYDVGRVNPNSGYGRQWPLQIAADGERVPTLDAFLAFAKSAVTPVRLNIETKLSPLAPGDTVDPATFARTVVEALRAAGWIERTTLQSFDWRTLVEAKKLEPRLATACLTIEGGDSDNVKADASGRSPWLAGIEPASVPAMAKAAGCKAWTPFWRNLTPERLAEAKGLGLAVIPWTVNEPADLRAVIALGVDGVITDYPDRARKAMAEKNLPLPAPAR